MRANRVLIVGRFQPLHNGHILVIRQMMKRFDAVILGIGSAQYSHTPDNPFTAGERIEMAVEALRDEPVDDFYVVPIEDIHEHGRWVGHVVSLVPRFDAVATNNPLNCCLFKESGHEVVQTPMFHRRNYSGTAIRKRILAKKPWKTLVPPAVGRIIGEINGEGRIRQISRSDQ